MIHHRQMSIQPLSKPTSKIFYMNILEDLRSRFGAPPEDSIEGVILRGIQEMMADNNTRAAIRGHTVRLNSKWSDARVSIIVDFQKATAHIQPGYSEDVDENSARKVMLADEEAFNKIEAISRFILT